MRHARPVAVAIMIALMLCPQTFAADETFGQKLVGSAISSAGSKGGEFAVKFVAGWIYNISCKPEQQNDEGSKALCGALGSLSGKTEEQWKQQVVEKLDKISGKLDAIQSSQKEILRRIESQHKAMDEQFTNLPSAIQVTAILTTIDTFWLRMENEFETPTKNPQKHNLNFNKVDMENLARDIMHESLHIKLGQLNTLLAHGVNRAEPLLRVPFKEFRTKYTLGAPIIQPLDTYDFAEKRFAYYRAEQQKGYILYLWAAEIVQSECEIRKDERCAALPMTSKAFEQEYERYTRDQMKTFATAANWIVLAYSRPDLDDPNIFKARRSDLEPVLMRLNYLESTILGDGKEGWGEVVTTANDPWDGSIRVDCAGKSHVMPIFTYNVPVDTQQGSQVDWWTSRAKNKTYDEVHFASSWKVYQYKVATSRGGQPCFVDSLTNNQPLPWTSRGDTAMVTKDGETFPVGFFYAVHRAGGTYALASGQDWVLPASPETKDSGIASKKDTRFDWTISGAHHESAWIGLLNMASVQQTFGKTLQPTQEAKVFNRIYAYNRKSIYFPEGGSVALRMHQHEACEKLCRGVDTVERGILDYDVENSPYENGSLKAIVAIFLDTKEGLDNIDERAKNGIYLDGSYNDTKERKSMRVHGEAKGVAEVKPGQAYHVEYLIEFDLKTNTKRADATTYRFLGKITPSLLFVTQPK
ncbi:MAG TPA: hypothetical protein VGJ81_14030 [Thermoanaerobaculia bacterium]